MSEISPSESTDSSTADQSEIPPPDSTDMSTADQSEESTTDESRIQALGKAAQLNETPVDHLLNLGSELAPFAGLSAGFDIVSQTVPALAELVQHPSDVLSRTVKDAVQDTAAAVKDAVQDTTAAVKDAARTVKDSAQAAKAAMMDTAIGAVVEALSRSQDLNPHTARTEYSHHGAPAESSDHPAFQTTETTTA